MSPSRPNLGTIILPAKTGPAGVVIRRWRVLSGGSRVRDPERRTLIACSGGADSSALALCLAAATSHLVIAHVLHDLRPDHEARADLESARALAAGLAIPFASASVTCKSQRGNVEAVARRERYAALVAMAREHACPFIATAHHADDQLETLLMRLVRGAGPRGLAGIAPKRRLAPGVTLIRPMLEVTRVEAEAICGGAGVVWAEDATNADRSRLRAALRHDVIPGLRAIAPSIARTAGRVASVQRAIAGELARAAAGLLARSRVDARDDCLSRESLAAAPGPVLEAALREIITRVARSPDALSARSMARLIAAVRSRSGEATSFEFPGAIAKLDGDKLVIQARRD